MQLPCLWGTLFVFFTAFGEDLGSSLNWEQWLSQTGISAPKFESLVEDTAISLGLSAEGLLESLQISSDQPGAPDPVELLLQLREELQLSTDLGDSSLEDESRDKVERLEDHIQSQVGDQAGLSKGYSGEDPDEETVRAEVTRPSSPLSERSPSPSSFDAFFAEMKEVILADVQKLQQVIDSVVPEPIRIAFAQAATKVYGVARAMWSLARKEIAPKFYSLVLEDGSPGRRFVGRTASYVRQGLALAREKVEGLVAAQRTNLSESSEIDDEAVEAPFLE